jgi:chromosome segregation ATPase
MKRFTTLALVVFALAAVPAAFADDVTPPAPPTTTPTTAPVTAPVKAPVTAPTTAPTKPDRQKGAAGKERVRIELLRLRLEIVKLRFRLHCGPNGKAPADKCHARAEEMLARLKKIDANVQAKLAELKACTPDSTDPKCKNADRKIEVLTKLDERLQNAIKKLQDYLDGKSTTPADPSSDSALDQAANQLGQLAGSNG